MFFETAQLSEKDWIELTLRTALLQIDLGRYDEAFALTSVALRSPLESVDPKYFQNRLYFLKVAHLCRPWRRVAPARCPVLWSLVNPTLLWSLFNPTLLCAAWTQALAGEHCQLAEEPFRAMVQVQRNIPCSYRVRTVARGLGLALPLPRGRGARRDTHREPRPAC